MALDIGLEHEAERQADGTGELPSEQRSRAAYQVVERLLDESVSSEKQLLPLLSPLTGEEYLQAAEERALAGQCGNALCGLTLQKKGKAKLLHSFLPAASRPVDPNFCSAACEDCAHEVAGKLGGISEALDRFADSTLEPRGPHAPEEFAAGTADNPIMLYTVQENHGELADPQHAAQEARTTSTTSGTRPQGSASPTNSQPLPTSSFVDSPMPSLPGGFASSEARDSATLPGTSSGDSLPGTSSGGSARADAVEGYSPRAIRPSRSSLSSREQHVATFARKSVTWGDESGSSLQEVREVPSLEEGVQRRRSFTEDPRMYEDCQGYAPGAGSNGAGPSGHASGYDGLFKQVTSAPKERPSVLGDVVEREPMDVDVETKWAAAPHAAHGPAQPVLVFEVVDPKSPLDVEARFGRLKVADAADVGLSAQEAAALAADARGAREGECTGGAGEGELTGGGGQRTLEDDLRWWNEWSAQHDRPGSGAPPSAGRPVEAVAAFDVDEIETDDEEEGTEMESDGEGNDAMWYDEPPQGFANELMGFARLFKLVDEWVTPATIAYLEGGAGPRFLPSSTQSLNASPDAQVVAALRGVVARALRGVLRRVCISTPTSCVERELDVVLRTLRLSGALPSLKEAQWQLLVLVLIRALGEERLPSLQTSTHSPAGEAQLEKAALHFGSSMEELFALVELLVPPVTP